MIWREGKAEIYGPVGCDYCDYTGFKGRSGIYELIQVDSKLRSMIHERCSEDEMLKHVRVFSPSLMDNGLSKVLAGETSLDEVVRVNQGLNRPDTI